MGVAPEFHTAIDQNPSLFNNRRVLEIVDVPEIWDAALNGVCYEAAASPQVESFFAEQSDLGESSINFQREPEEYRQDCSVSISATYTQRTLRPPGCEPAIGFWIYIGTKCYDAETTTPCSELKYGAWCRFKRKDRFQNRSWASYANQHGRFRILWK